MALTVGTNCGFCASAPSGDPGGSEFQAVNARWGARFTSPAGATTITEIGWYQSDNSVAAVAYEVGVYTDSATGPGTLVGTIQTGQSLSTSAGWNKYTGLSIAISGSTLYWLCCACASGSPPGQLHYGEVTGYYDIYKGSETTLPSPTWGESATSENESLAIYALYSTGGAAATGTAALSSAAAALASSGQVIAFPAYGYDAPDAGEIAQSWTTWHLGAGATISGNADYGDLVIPPTVVCDGPVVDMGDATNKEITLSTKYGTNEGAHTKYIRGSDTTFAWDAGSPSWSEYTGAVTQEWRYVQARIVGA